MHNLKLFYHVHVLNYLKGTIVAATTLARSILKSTSVLTFLALVAILNIVKLIDLVEKSIRVILS